MTEAAEKAVFGHKSQLDRVSAIFNLSRAASINFEFTKGEQITAVSANALESIWGIY